MKTWSMGSRSYGVGDQEWFFIVDESDRIVARVHPAATETDEETGETCTGVADYAAIPDVRLMLAAPQLYDALAEFVRAATFARSLADLDAARGNAMAILSSADNSEWSKATV